MKRCATGLLMASCFAAVPAVGQITNPAGFEHLRFRMAVSEIADTSTGAGDEIRQEIPRLMIAEIKRSAIYRTIHEAPANLYEFGDPDVAHFPSWQELGADFLVAGWIRDLPSGGRVFGCYIFNTSTRDDVHHQGYIIDSDDWKQLPGRCLYDFEKANEVYLTSALTTAREVTERMSAAKAGTSATTSVATRADPPNAAPAAAATTKPALSKEIIPARFGTIPLPTPDRPVYTAAAALEGKERRTISFRRPCKSQDDHDYDGIKLVVWKSPVGESFQFTWCRDGSQSEMQTFASEAAIARMQAAMVASGALTDTDGHTFTWPAFAIGKKYQIEYWSWPQLQQNWFLRAGGADTSVASTGIAGGPGHAAILAAHGLAYARNYSGQTTANPGEVAYPSPFGGIAYYERRQLSDVSCRKTAAETFRCSYRIAKTFEGDNDSIFGKLTAAFIPNQPPTPFSYTYIRKAGSWTSPELMSTVRAESEAARLRQSQRASNGSSNTPCTVYGGVSANWDGGNGMISGMSWDPSIRTPC